ncbi:hypothetical protein BJV74DRAFT_876312 [Russula compacta]|nr:hypothetical protein BJV74DRAFT_876312 [Russula compacta]
MAQATQENHKLIHMKQGTNMKRGTNSILGRFRNLQGRDGVEPSPQAGYTLTTCGEAKTALFCKFHCQLFHLSLSHILQVLKPYLDQWEVVQCSDGHYQQVVYGLGPYIADYEEQVLLACIVHNWCPRYLSHWKNLDEGGLWHSHEHTHLVINELDSNVLWDEFSIMSNLMPFTNDFPQANICCVLSPNILHQLIKGTFKDHLVDWVERFLVSKHGKKQANMILDEIDHCIASVYIAAIEGFVPIDMLCTLRAFLKFCYLVHKDIITQPDLIHFHHYREVLKNMGVVESLSLPCQHSLLHYFELIKQLRAPNGLCSSITESKHIKAVKMPYRQSSHHQVLGQILACSMLISWPGEASARSKILKVVEEMASQQDDLEDSELVDDRHIDAFVQLAKCRQYQHAKTIIELADELRIPHLPHLIHAFLHTKTHSNDDEPCSTCPFFIGKISVVNSASTTFYAPSDLYGKEGMWQENEGPCQDCGFVVTNPDSLGFWGMDVAHMLCFFFFLVLWTLVPFMWVVKPSTTAARQPKLAVIHINSIFCATHLIPVFTAAPQLPPQGVHPHCSYDYFHLFYVNKFADHHAFTMVF